MAILKIVIAEAAARSVKISSISTLRVRKRVYLYVQRLDLLLVASVLLYHSLGSFGEETVTLSPLTLFRAMDNGLRRRPPLLAKNS